MRRFAALLTLVLALMPLRARAHWQYTRWGMTPEEVTKASEGAAGPLTEADRPYRFATASSITQELSADYTSGDLRFRAIFGFEGGKLSLVTLHLLNDGGDGPKLRMALEGKYGSPFSDSASRYMRHVKWQDDKNEVLYSDVGGKGAQVSYRPRKTANNAGL